MRVGVRLRRGGISRHPVLACIGDSFTFNDTYLTLADYYPAVLASRLGFTPLNLGVSGNSTAQVMNRRRQLVRYGLPARVGIGGANNDLNAQPAVVAASPAPTTTTFSLDSHEVYYAADGWILVGGVSAQILSISSKAITLTAPLAGGAPAAGATVTIDTQKNLEQTISYINAAGVPLSKIFVLGVHYLNYSSGGDTTSAQQSLASQSRTAQSAAAAAQGVTYIDTYAYMRALIVAGTYTQGDNGWHVAASNSHLNAAGQRILADCIYAAIA